MHAGKFQAKPQVSKVFYEPEALASRYSSEPSLKSASASGLNLLGFAKYGKGLVVLRRLVPASSSLTENRFTVIYYAGVSCARHGYPSDHSAKKARSFFPTRCGVGLLRPQSGKNDSGQQRKNDSVENVHGDPATKPEYKRKLGGNVRQQSSRCYKLQDLHEFGSFG
jgi:hypothetical protein